MQNDGEAARRVFAADCRRRLMVGVNVTRTVVTDEAAIARPHASRTRKGRFAAAILESYMDFYRLQPEWITRSLTGPVNTTHDGFATRAHVMRTAEGHPVAWDVEPAPDSGAVTGVAAVQFLEHS